MRSTAWAAFLYPRRHKLGELIFQFRYLNELPHIERLISDIPLEAILAQLPGNQSARFEVVPAVLALHNLSQELAVSSALWATQPGKMLGRSQVIIPMHGEVQAIVIVQNAIAGGANHS